MRSVDLLPRRALRVSAAMLALCLSITPLRSQSMSGNLTHFSEHSGEALYKAICQGCHMRDAEGATGAGSYPALASNAKLGNVGYPLLVVIRGQKAMPPFGGTLSDEQIAAVVNYVRSHFGNDYPEDVTVQDVKAAR
jgi:mono/diheme cytochrome c family protein